MTPPHEFAQRLQHTFDGRLRVRWSLVDREWVIEQKVGHGRIPPARIEEGRDDLIRARDGYHFVMSVTTGDRTRCRACHYLLHVPVRDTADIRCGYCKLRGKHSSVVAGYWPLDDTLIDHLRKLDPLNTHSEKLAQEADLHNQRLLRSMEDAAMAPGYAEASDMYRRLVGIPMTGWTGIEKT